MHWVIGKVLASLSVDRLMCGSPRELMTAHTEDALWERTLESLPGSFSPPCCWKHDTSHCLAEFTVSQNLKKNMILSILTEKNLSHPGSPTPAGHLIWWSPLLSIFLNMTSICFSLLAFYSSTDIIAILRQIPAWKENSSSENRIWNFLSILLCCIEAKAFRSSHLTFFFWCNP